MSLLQAGGKRDLFYFAPAQGAQRQADRGWPGDFGDGGLCSLFSQKKPLLMAMSRNLLRENSSLVSSLWMRLRPAFSSLDSRGFFSKQKIEILCSIVLTAYQQIQPAATSA